MKINGCDKQGQIEKEINNNEAAAKFSFSLCMASLLKS